MFQQQEQVEEEQQSNNEFDNMIYNNFEDFDNIIEAADPTTTTTTTLLMDDVEPMDIGDDEQNYNYIVQNLTPQSSSNFLDCLNSDYSNISVDDENNDNNNIIENTGEFYDDDDAAASSSLAAATSGCLVYSINDFAHSQLHNYINNSYQDNNQISETDMTYAQYQQQQRQLTDTCNSYGVGHLNTNTNNNNNNDENLYNENFYNNYINNNLTTATTTTTTTTDTFYNNSFATDFNNNNIFSQNYDILKNKIDDEEIFKLIKDCEDTIELELEECEENANIINIVLNSIQGDDNTDDFMNDLNKTTDLLKADAINDILKEFPSLSDDDSNNEIINHTEIEHLLLAVGEAGSSNGDDSETANSSITNYHDIMNEFQDLSNGGYFDDEDEITPTINPLVDVQSYLTDIDMLSSILELDAAKDLLNETIIINNNTTPPPPPEIEDEPIIITPISTNLLLINPRRNRKMLSINDCRRINMAREFSDADDSDTDSQTENYEVPEILEIASSPIPVLNLQTINDDIVDQHPRFLPHGSKQINEIIRIDDDDDNTPEYALRRKIEDEECVDKLKRSYYKVNEDIIDEPENNYASSSGGSSMSKRARLGEYDYVSSSPGCSSTMDMSPPNSPNNDNNDDEYLQLFPDSDSDNDDKCDKKKIKLENTNEKKNDDKSLTFYKVKNISSNYMSDDVTIENAPRRGNKTCRFTIYHHKLYNIKHKISDMCELSKTLNFFMCTQKTKMTNKKTYPPYLYSLTLFGGRRISTKNSTRAEKIDKTGIIYSFENDIKFKFDFNIKRKNANDLSQDFFNNDNQHEFTIKKSDKFNFNYVYFNNPIRKFMVFGKDNHVSYRGVRISRGVSIDDNNRPILVRGAIFHYMQDCESSALVRSKNHQSRLIRYIHDRMVTNHHHHQQQ